MCPERHTRKSSGEKVAVGIFSNGLPVPVNPEGRCFSAVIIKEAVALAAQLTDESTEYPVHFAASNTSGEKPYEEFFTEAEHVDEARLQALGVITGKSVPDREAIRVLFEQLEAAFVRADVTKADVVRVMQGYLPNFHHIETGLSLDSKM